LEDASEELAGLFRTIHAVKPEYRIAGLFQILANLCSDTHTDWQPLSPMAAVQQVAAGHNHLRLQKVIDTIQENFHRHVGLEEMSGLVHMAPPSFSRWFRRTMHMTFTDYLNRVRIEECCRQLRFTDHPITVIAKDCGFESLSNFNRQFHRLRDCAPRTWRSRHKEAVAQL
jgi:AraC-like DNA-binding protein